MIEGFYRVMFWLLLGVVLVGVGTYGAVHQHYSDKNQFERLYQLEHNQAEIIRFLQSKQGK